MVGIYKITVEHKSYIGSSIDIKTRIKQHHSDLKCNRHCNPLLQRAYNRYQKFAFEVLETLETYDDCTLRTLEKSYIDKLKPECNIQDPVTHFGQKKVYQFDLSGALVAEYDNITQAAITLGLSSSNIFHAAQVNEVNTRTAGGFYWQYEKDFKERTPDKRHTPIYVYTLAGFYLKSYNSVKECILDLFPTWSYTDVTSRINRVCKGKAASFQGYRFSYEKKNYLDNSLLLSIKSWYPILMVTPSKEVEVFEKTRDCVRHTGFSQPAISKAIKNQKPYRGYIFMRLGTESHELLESLEGTKTETELETVDGKV